MASLAELARIHCSLSEGEIAHLQRLVETWGLLSDLSFSDLLLSGSARLSTFFFEAPGV